VARLVSVREWQVSGLCIKVLLTPRIMANARIFEKFQRIPELET